MISQALAPRFLRALLLCFLGLGAQAMPSTVAADESQVEEELDEGLKGFGYLTGLAMGCVVEQQRPTLEREAMDLHAEITRLLGSDRAFLFSAGFGHGTGVELKLDECKTVLERYEARVTRFRQARGSK